MAKPLENPFTVTVRSFMSGSDANARCSASYRTYS